MTARTVVVGELSEEQRRVHRAGQALHRDGASPAGALELLAAIVEDRTWERVADVHGRPFAGRFRDFVEAKSPYGLGYEVDQLPKLLSLRHPHEGVAKVADQMGRMRTEVRRLLVAGIPAADGPGGDRRSATYQACDTNLKPDRVEHVVARLKRDRPDLAAKVESEEMSADAAAKQMGWRRHRIVLSTPQRIAASIRKHLTADQCAELARLLTDA